MLCAVSPASDQFEETLNTLKYANRAKSMSPPQIPQRQVHTYNPVAEQVEVLQELKETLIPMMRQVSGKRVAPPLPGAPDDKSGAPSRDEPPPRRRDAASRAAAGAARGHRRTDSSSSGIGRDEASGPITSQPTAPPGESARSRRSY